MLTYIEAASKKAWRDMGLVTGLIVCGNVVGVALDDWEGSDGKWAAVDYGISKVIAMEDSDSCCYMDVEMEFEIDLFAPFNPISGLIQMNMMLPKFIQMRDIFHFN